MLRRLRLSRMVTSLPRSDRYSEVGHPQNPSPPRTRTRIPTPVTVALVQGCPAARAARRGARLCQIGSWRPGARTVYLPITLPRRVPADQGWLSPPRAHVPPIRSVYPVTAD